MSDTGTRDMHRTANVQPEMSPRMAGGHTCSMDWMAAHCMALAACTVTVVTLGPAVNADGDL